MNKILTFICCFATATGSFAQFQQLTTIKGTVCDSTTRLPMEFATVSIKNMDGYSIASTMTGQNGTFEFKNVTAGRYSLGITFMGYTELTRTVRIAGEAVNVGTLWLKPDTKRLDEIVVSTIGNSMIVKKDTIEYNAASYKVTEGAVLEDLVKKLDGVEVEDGKITVNGKEVKKIMVDGKTFFSDDPQIAMKNLPANIVNKLQVIDRKSDQARFSGIDDGNEETVLNLTIQPGMKNGWFGNATAGAGYKDRFQGGGMAAHIKDNMQIMLLLSGNNTNNRGFNDIAGNMMQQGRSGGGNISFSGRGGGTQGGYNMNIGGTRMNVGGNGITTSWMGGTNFYNEFGNNLKVTGNYMYSGAETSTDNKNYRQNLFKNDSTSNYNQQTLSVTQTQGHRVSFEIEWAIDSLNSFIFKPNANFGLGNFNEQTEYVTLAMGQHKVNEGVSKSFGDNTSMSFNGDILYRHKFKTAGRTFSANLVIGYSNSEINGNNYSYMKLFDQSRDTVVDQQYHTKNNSFSTNTRFSYTEPLKWLGKSYYAELAYGIRINQSASDKETFDKNIVGDYVDLNSEYTNHYRNLFINQRAELNVRNQREKYNWTVGLQVQPSYLRSEKERVSPLSRTTFKFSPNGNFIYNFSDHKQFRAEYRGNTNEPSISQLQPVPDNSNPLLQRLGNPDLSPSFNHTLRLIWRDSDMKSFRTIVAGLNISMTNNSIVNNNIYEMGTGRQLIVPMNVDGVYSFMGNFMISTPFKRGSKFSIMANTMLQFTQNVSLTHTIPQIPDDESLLNYILSQSEQNITNTLYLTEMLRLNYRGDKIDIALNARASCNQAWYSLSSRTDRSPYWSNSAGGNFNWTLPWNLALASDANYMYYIGASEGYNRPTFMWNAEVSKLLFKQKQGIIKVRVFDILSEGRGTVHNTTENYIEDSSVNTLGRYVMFSFTYRFGSFGSQRNSQRNITGFPQTVGRQRIIIP